MAGRPPHEPTEKSRTEVKALAGFGISEADIGKHLGITSRTLRKYYREELDTGHIQANAKVAAALFRQAVDKGNVTAQIFWLKTRARWKIDVEDNDDEVPANKVVVSIKDARKQ